jgi:hypothetical protein
MEALQGQRSKGLQTPYTKVEQFPPTGESKIRGVEAHDAYLLSYLRDTNVL